MIRVLTVVLTILMLCMPANAVKLADGKEVGMMFGYAALCIENIGKNPSKNSEDKLAGERYGMWLKTNTRNPEKIFNDFLMNINMGMAAAARSNYGQCEQKIKEMIGFYQFFNLEGTSYTSVLSRFAKKEPQQKPVVATEPASNCPKKSLGTTTTDAFFVGFYAPEGVGNAVFHVGDVELNMDATEEDVAKYFGLKEGIKVSVTYETSQSFIEGTCWKFHSLVNGHVLDTNNAVSKAPSIDLAAQIAAQKGEAVEFLTCEGAGNNLQEICSDGNVFSQSALIFEKDGVGSERAYKVSENFTWTQTERQIILTYPRGKIHKLVLVDGKYLTDGVGGWMRHE